MRMAAGSGNLRNMMRANSARNVNMGSGRLGSGRLNSGRLGSGRLGSGRLTSLGNNKLNLKGVKHIVKGQLPYVFRFDISIEYVDKLTTSEPVCVIWERSNEVLGTRSVVVDPSTNRATFNESMNKEVTLFKETADDPSFIDKVFKLAVRTGGSLGTTLGKIHINLAEYAAIPSSSKRVALAMSNGCSVIATIQSTFIDSARRKNDSNSREIGDADTDIGMDDENYSDLVDLGDDDDADAGESNSSAGDEPVAVTAQSPRTFGNGARRVSESNLGNSLRQEAADAGKRDVAMLHKKIVAQQKRIKDLEDQNAILMQDLAAAEGNTPKQSKWNKKSAQPKPAASFQSAAAEVQYLRSELARLEDMVSHEPEFMTLVGELKEVKMTLAMANLEKEQAKLDLMNHLKELDKKGKKGKRKKK
eukprot:Plantae.Rhodophyta-Rhodochaete_pulchella.ctg1863.p1 GENE.Plantae.Rhodophyta-Rhodochaete_pulchella.ctg1863~~Plantae.Rhodophyta-Rhodochaete_pulchella.ctg1863.p1  ORF type:complete len:418 (+),score=76.26 Plantae.Rhodophyta-Rhodochaete_pulchella.ctg1863:284-1537(+)